MIFSLKDKKIDAQWKLWLCRIYFRLSYLLSYVFFQKEFFIDVSGCEFRGLSFDPHRFLFDYELIGLKGCSEFREAHKNKLKDLYQA